MAHHNDLGKKGEEAAVEFLKKAGHTILTTNYRHQKAEVDIISSYKHYTVFTEVKLRSTASFGHPEEFVTKKKRELMKKAAAEYLLTHKIESEIRFDIISITVRENEFQILHIEDAFFHEEGSDNRYN
ncbi:MAG: YraN family protein [Chitinophagales bacterium]